MNLSSLSVAVLVAAGVITSAPVVVPWNRPDAVVLDYRNNRFAKSGTILADETALLAAMAGGDPYAVASVSGNVRTFGRFVAAGITEEMLDPDFDTGTSWTAAQASGGPATLAIVSGEGQLTANGSTNPAVSQPIVTQPGKAYRLVGKQKRGPGSNAGSKFVVSDTANLAAAVTQTSLVAGTTETEYIQTFSAVGNGGSTLYGGILTQAAAPTGYNIVSSCSVKECWPFDGFQQGAISEQIEFRVDAADLTGTKVLVSWDSGSINASAAAPYERSYIRLVCVSGDFRLQVFYETQRGTIGQQTSVSMGTLTAGYHKVQVAVTYGTAAVKLDANAPITQAITNLPGVAYMRLHGGQTPTTNDWSNSDTIVTHYNALTMPDGISSTIFGFYGDSYHSLASQIALTSGVIVSDKGQGGRTLQQILAQQVQTNPQLWNKPATLWDGKPNGVTTAAEYMAILDQIIAIHGTKLLVIGPCKTIVGSGENALIDAINAAMAARGSALKYIDPHTVIPQQGGVVASAYVNPDGVHVTTPAHQLVSVPSDPILKAM